MVLKIFINTIAKPNVERLIDGRGAKNRSSLRFLARYKNAGYWREIKTPDFAKIQCKNEEKNFGFFALFYAYRELCLRYFIKQERI